MDSFMNLRKYTLLVFAFIAFSVTVLRGQECSISNAVDITVVSDPSMIISGATTICSGGNATLNANITNPGAGDYLIEVLSGARHDVVTAHRDPTSTVWILQTRPVTGEDWGDLNPFSQSEDWSDLNAAVLFDDWQS